MKTIKVNIRGMSCISCENSIAQHFNKLNIEASVSFIESTATFTFDETDWVVEDIINNIRILGYKPYLESKYKWSKVDYLEFAELAVCIIIALFFFWEMFAMAKIVSAAPKFMMNGYVQLVLASYIQLFVGRRFYISAIRQLKNKKYGMDVLISLTTTLAYTYSIFILITKGPQAKEFFFGVSAEVITFLLIGKLIESSVKRKATTKLKKLLSLKERNFSLLNGTIKDMLELIKGDILIIKAGQIIPANAIIVEGKTTVDESTITGESLPINKNVGDEIISGSVNASKVITIKLIKDAKDSRLHLITKTIKDLQEHQAPIAKKVDQISNIFVPAVVVIIFLTIIYWGLIQNLPYGRAIYYAIAVAAVACPCALGLATPMSIITGVSRAAKENILYRKSDVFEKFKNINVIAFDKTGTITKGELFIDEIIGNKVCINVFASLEIISMHPIAKAFMNYKDATPNFKDVKIKNYEEFVGSGVKGTYNNKEYVIGSYEFVTAIATISEDMKKIYNKILNQGNVIIVGSIDNKVTTLFSLKDVIKETTISTIKKLHKQGVKTIMITGDNKVTADIVAKQIGITNVYSQVKPSEKQLIIKRLQDQGYTVAFAGDGVNDAEALAQADLSIAMGSGSDIAQTTADITILDSDLLSICKALIISQKTLKNIYQNIGWAFLWNGTMIPLAALGYLHPAIAALFMSVESIIVILNSTRLQLIKFN